MFQRKSAYPLGLAIASLVVGLLQASMNFITAIFLIRDTKVYWWDSSKTWGNFTAMVFHMFFNFLNICYFIWNIVFIVMSDDLRAKAFKYHIGTMVGPTVFIFITSGIMGGMEAVVRSYDMTVACMITAEVLIVIHIVLFLIFFYVYKEYDKHRLPLLPSQIPLYQQ